MAATTAPVSGTAPDVAGDVPPPRLVSPRGAIRRSLAVWGWGQLATGDRRGWLLVALELVAIPVFVLLALPYARGTANGFVFVAGALFIAVWAAQALHADRRAVRRASPFAPELRRSAGVELLWLAPIVVAGATGFWSLTGPATSPDDLLADYVALWRSDHPADASALFAVAPDAPALAAAWERQSARLTNEAIRAAAQAGPVGGIDPADPWAAVRWEPHTGPTGGSTDAGGPDAASADAVVVRRETVRDSFFGLVPTTSDRLLPVAALGTVRMRTVETPGPVPGAPPIVVWRIDGLTLLGESLGGS
jgi:hypothetical protein